MKIFVPFLQPYHLFTYLTPLCCNLAKNGHQITVMTFDHEILRQLQSRHGNLKAYRGPVILSFLHNRAANPFFRFLLWSCSWFWSIHLKSSYDAAIVPWDTKIIWFVTAKVLPSFMLNHSIEDIKNADAKTAADFFVRKNFGIAKSEKMLLVLDKLARGSLLPRYRGQVVDFNVAHLFIDRCMGNWSPNFYPGYGSAKLQGISGAAVQEQIGLGSDVRWIEVVGIPGYDQFCDDSFRVPPLGDIPELAALGLDANSQIFTIFAPVLREMYAKEVLGVISAIRKAFPDCTILVKTHPKSTESEVTSFQRMILSDKKCFVVAGREHGDLLNAQLFRLSFCTFMTGSKLILLGLCFESPMILFDLGGRKSLEFLPEFSKNTECALTQKALDEAVVRLKNRDNCQKLVEQQLILRDRFLGPTGKSASRIGELMQERLLKE